VHKATALNFLVVNGPMKGFLWEMLGAPSNIAGAPSN